MYKKSRLDYISSAVNLKSTIEFIMERQELNPKLKMEFEKQCENIDKILKLLETNYDLPEETHKRLNSLQKLEREINGY